MRRRRRSWCANRPQHPAGARLLARAEVGEIVPGDLFDIIAEVILWAREVRSTCRRNATRLASRVPLPAAHRGSGEDLTQYDPKQQPRQGD
jgi:hypothetical protein